MKICFFSDIHGNGQAFQAAFDRIQAEQADVNVFLGDLCGYYYDQLRIFDMLMQIPNFVAIKGNHDDIFLRILDGDQDLRKVYKQKYGFSMENLLTEKTVALENWLRPLPDQFVFSNLGLACFHGSPVDALNGYVYPDSPIEGFLKHQANCFVLGHTHFPMKRKIQDKLIINPGSLGQARNGGWPTYAVLQYPSGDVAIKEVVYDKAALRKQIQTFGDVDRYLDKVLDRTK